MEARDLTRIVHGRGKDMNWKMKSIRTKDRGNSATWRRVMCLAVAYAVLVAPGGLVMGPAFGQQAEPSAPAAPSARKARPAKRAPKKAPKPPAEAAAWTVGVRLMRSVNGMPRSRRPNE